MFKDATWEWMDRQVQVGLPSCARAAVSAAILDVFENAFGRKPSGTAWATDDIGSLDLLGLLRSVDGDAVGYAKFRRALRQCDGRPVLWLDAAAVSKQHQSRGHVTRAFADAAALLLGHRVPHWLGGRTQNPSVYRLFAGSANHGRLVHPIDPIPSAIADDDPYIWPRLLAYLRSDAIPQLNNRVRRPLDFEIVDEFGVCRGAYHGVRLGDYAVDTASTSRTAPFETYVARRGVDRDAGDAVALMVLIASGVH